MSVQHGTETKRTNVGSQSLQYAYEGFIGAGLGYYTLVPDYLGLGESTLMHPYHCAKASAETVIDFIRACRTEAETLNKKLNGQVFLAGYSEGGLCYNGGAQRNSKKTIQVKLRSRHQHRWRALSIYVKPHK
jgi:hypothetical protein